jgi:hypothetical protein
MIEFAPVEYATKVSKCAVIWEMYQSKGLSRNIPCITCVMCRDVGAVNPPFPSRKAECDATLESSLKFSNYIICQLVHSAKEGRPNVLPSRRPIEAVFIRQISKF